MEPATSWFLVGFVPAASRWELHRQTREQRLVLTVITTSCRVVLATGAQQEASLEGGWTAGCGGVGWACGRGVEVWAGQAAPAPRPATAVGSVGHAPSRLDEQAGSPIPSQKSKVLEPYGCRSGLKGGPRKTPYLSWGRGGCFPPPHLIRCLLLR